MNAVSKLMDICDLVPGWMYAVVVAVLAVMLVVGEIDRDGAITEAAQAGRQLSELKADVAAAAASSTDQARSKEFDAGAVVSKVTDEYHQETANPADRVATVVQRMREPAAAYRASGCHVSPVPGAASGVDGSGGAGLRSLDDADPLVFDDQAQSDTARLVVSANGTGKALKAVRVLLHQCWRMTNDAEQ